MNQNDYKHDLDSPEPDDGMIVCDCGHRGFEEETLELKDGTIFCVNCAMGVNKSMEEAEASKADAKREYDARAMAKCPECGERIGVSTSEYCQDCCPHDEHDHGICLECSKDIMDDLVGRAELLRDE